MFFFIDPRCSKKYKVGQCRTLFRLKPDSSKTVENYLATDTSSSRLPFLGVGAMSCPGYRGPT